MKKKQIKTLLIKASLLSVPFWLIFISYVILDPFKVIKSYESYYPKGQTCYVALNRDYVSTEVFLKNYPVYKYNSFIFGNSRSLFYKTEDWERYISPASCFHFDASAETLYGIYIKIKYLESRNVEIKNALVILDNSVLKRTSDTGKAITCKHPMLTGKSGLLFHFKFIKTFYNPNFLLAYYDLVITKKIKDYMIKEFLFDNTPWDHVDSTNELLLNYYEEQIENDRDGFYASREKLFFKRDGGLKYTLPVIHDKQKKMLYEIFSKFKKDKTDYKIIISPIYDQQKFNEDDFVILENIFGKENVFDFSGINEITENKYNYYEMSHYRPHVAKKIMDIIYAESASGKNSKRL